MSGLRVPVVGPRCQIRLASAAPAAPNSAIDTSTPANSTKAQTHSPQTACFQRFSPNGSALWQPHRLKLRPRRHRSGELRHTRVRHAGDTPTQRFEWRKTHTTTGVERTSSPGRPDPSARGLWQGSARFRADTPSHPAHPSHRISGTKLSPLTHPHRISGTKLSPLTRNGSIWRNPRMQGEFCTVLTTKKPSRENFVPNARQKSS